MPSRSELERMADAAARKWGVPSNIYRAQIGRESGWNTTAGSPAGAQGIAQIHLPSHPDITAEQANDPVFALDWGAQHMASLYKQTGSWKGALAAYNAGLGAYRSGAWKGYEETTDYVTNVLNDAGNIEDLQDMTDVQTPGTSTTVDPISGLAKIGAGMPTKQSVALGAMQGLGQGKPIDFLDMAGQLAVAKQAEAVASKAAASTPTTPTTPGAQPPGQTPGTTADVSEWVTVPKPAGSSSEPHTPEILQWVAGLGQVADTRLTVFDNTTHSRTTVNGNESAHYHGNAADIAASGEELRRLGYLALVKAGMPEAQAQEAARSGGLFNVGGMQIIFATNEGGNHYDHLHVGFRGH